jgi:hypothetical protein
MRDYLDHAHQRADEPTVPLWPNRAPGGACRRGPLAIALLDFSESVDTDGFQKNLLRAASEAFVAGEPSGHERYRSGWVIA